MKTVELAPRHRVELEGDERDPFDMARSAASYRGRGLARRVVEAAIVRAQGLGPEFVILFCLPDRRGLYSRLGFAEITDEVRVEQPDGASVMTLRAMWRALNTDAEWPRGAVTVCSLPF